MNIVVNRFVKKENSSFGTLSIDGAFQCFTLEDAVRPDKIAGKTAIPAGIYEIGLRNEGGFFERYNKRFTFQRGMLEIKNVPNFTYVLIHCGNDVDDTAGCLLVGNSLRSDGYLMGSVAAYKEMHFLFCGL